MATNTAAMMRTTFSQPAMTRMIRCPLRYSSTAMRRLPLLLGFLLLVLPAAAQTWHPIGPDGGRFARLLLDRNAPGRIFASAGRIWMSDDGGASWRRLAVPESGATLVGAVSDPHDRNVLWL